MTLSTHPTACLWVLPMAWLFSHGAFPEIDFTCYSAWTVTTARATDDRGPALRHLSCFCLSELQTMLPKPRWFAKRALPFVYGNIPKTGSGQEESWEQSYNS